jgi:hypothetical protein
MIILQTPVIASLEPPPTFARVGRRHLQNEITLRFATPRGSLGPEPELSFRVASVPAYASERFHLTVTVLNRGCKGARSL